MQKFFIISFIFLTVFCASSKYELFLMSNSYAQVPLQKQARSAKLKQSASPSVHQIESRLLQLIPDQSTQSARDAKLKEMENLKNQLDKNLTGLQKYNSLFEECIDDFYGCVETSCDGVLENCVSVQTGLKEDKITMASLQCYPTYRSCVTVQLSNEMAKMENEDIYPMLKKMNGEAMQQMAVESIFEKLTNEYVRLMKKSCEMAGGFYYDGLCGVFVARSTEETSFTTLSSGKFVEKILHDRKDVGFILPGVSLTKDKSESMSSNTSVTATGEDSRVFKIPFFTKPRYEQTVTGITISYSFSNDFYMMINDGNGGMKKSSPDGLIFIPEGWDRIVTDQCFPVRTFESDGKTPPVEQALSLIKSNSICTPEGYIRDKISKTMKENWSKIFKN